MAPSLRRATLVWFLSSVASFASAQPSGSLNTWVDACQATDPDLQALLATEALIVEAPFLEDNGDGTFELEHEPFDMGTNTGGLPTFPMCAESRFYGETRVKVPGTFRSAFQVGPDLVLTGWHSPVTGGVSTLRVVFGVHGRVVGGSCVPPDFSRIPASDVYSVTLVADGMSLPEAVDSLLLRLDRARGGSYPRVRRSGRGYPGDAVTIVSHPERLAAKVDTAGIAGDVGLSAVGRETLQIANVHTLVGSSGSMLYNRTQRMLEAVVVAGPLGADIVPTGDTDPDCHVIVHEDGWASANASMRYFAHRIPAFELQVNSLDWVVLKAATGTPVADQSTRRISALAGGGPIAYQIVPPAPSPAGEPSLTISPGGPLQGTLAAGQGLAVQQSAAASEGVPCGIYEKTYLVRDLTHGFEDVARHVFEIGKRGFTVSEPREPMEDLAAPFEETVAYTVRNTEPGPFTLMVSTDQPWVSFNGQPGPLFVSFAPGDMKQVLVGVLDSYASLPRPEEYRADIWFEVAPDWSDCPASPPVTRPFLFRYGTERFRLEPHLLIPDAFPEGVFVEQLVNESACIGDVDVHLKTQGVSGPQLVFRLKSPDPGGIERTIWDHGPEGPTKPLEVVLNEGILNDFEQHGSAGTWRLNVADTVSSPAPGHLEAWELMFTACPFP